MVTSIIFNNRTDPVVSIDTTHLFSWKFKGINCATDDYSLGTVSSLDFEFETDLEVKYIKDQTTVLVYINNQSNAEYCGYVTSIERVKNTKNHFHVYATDVEESLDTPIGESDLTPVENETLAQLAGRLHIPYDTTIGVNGSYVVNPNWGYTGVTKRDVARWIYQLQGLNYGGAAEKEVGGINIVNWFAPTTISTGDAVMLVPSEVKSIDKADYMTQQIDRIWFGNDESDTGLSYGNGTQSLLMPINPLINYNDTSFLQPIYNKVNALISYTPMKISTYLDGSKLISLIHNQQRFWWMSYTEDGVTYSCPIFNWEASPEGITLEGKGSPDRTTTNAYLGGEISNAGKFNKFNRTLDETRSEVGTLSGQVSTISQTAASLTIEVANKVGKDEVISSINQTAETITINANKINLVGAVTFSDLDSSTQNAINDKTDASEVTQIIGNTVNAAYINALEINAKKIVATYTKTFNHNDYNSNDKIVVNQLRYSKNWTQSNLDRYDINMDGQITDTDVNAVRDMVDNGVDKTATIKTEIDPSKVGNPIAIYANGATTPGASMNGSSVRGGAGFFNNITASSVINSSEIRATNTSTNKQVLINGNQVEFRDVSNGSALIGAITPSNIIIDSGTTSTTTNYTSGSQSFSCWIDWDYRKWGDGTYECWGKANLYVAAGQWANWGSVRSLQTLTPHLNYPVTFLSAPHEHVTACSSNDDWGFWVSAGANTNCNNTTTTTARYQLIRGADGSIGSYSSVPMRLEFYVVGKVAV